MRPRQPLPARVPRAFSTASAVERGVAAKRLRGPDVAHPFHGVNTLSDVDPTEAYRVRMLEGQFFSHHTAARVYGIPLERAPASVHVSVVAPRTPPRAAGVTGHRIMDDVDRGELPDGTPICAAAEVWCQLGGLIRVSDLVAAADHLIGARKRAPLASLEDLLSTSRRYRGRRGSRDRAWALSQARWGSDSRPESLLRLLIEPHVAGPVLVNQQIDIDGRALHPDLMLPSKRLVLEYEGDHHRVERDQWNEDLARHDLFVEAGWRVLRVTAHHLFAEPEALARKGRNVPDFA
jgi:very-short-patch-repair endonuclease